MKFYIPCLLTLILIIITILGYSQSVKQHYKWQASFNLAYEQHDKRLFKYVGKDYLLDLHPEKWGTYWYGIGLYRTILQNDFFQLKAGIAYSTEIQTFTRPYLFPGDPDQFLDVTNYYKSKHVQFPIEYTLNLIEGFRFSASAFTDFCFYKRAGYQGGTKRGKDKRRFNLDFYTFSLYPGLEYNWDRWSIRADYRLFQLKKIDKVIFNGILFPLTNPPDPRLDDKYETYNPAHIRLTVSYAFGEKELKTRE